MIKRNKRNTSQLLSVLAMITFNRALREEKGTTWTSKQAKEGKRQARKAKDK